MTKRVKIILAHFVPILVVCFISIFQLIYVETSTFLILSGIYVTLIIGLIIYNFVKKKNYEAKSHLIFLVILLSLIIILVASFFYMIRDVNVPVGIS